MTNAKQKRNARRKQALNQITRKAQQLSLKTKKQTPFADAGSIIGNRVGSMFGFPHAKGIGRWLGTGIGSIFGSGDYQVVGQEPTYNVLANGNQIPKFSSTRQTNIVSHREYLGDINGTATFTNRLYPINPGSSVTFPWLSTIAQNYQQYKIHGLIFEFRPLITDFVTSGAPGVVVMATNYNADEPLYATKQEMENSEYAVSVKPTNNLMHGVECATNQTVLSELYVRPGGLASNLDLKFTDLGSFQFASQGNPVQLLGELWCSYTIEFFKPILPKDIGGDIKSSVILRTGVTPAFPLGTAQSSIHGDLPGPLTCTSTDLSFVGSPGNYYLVTLWWTGSVSTAVFMPTLTPSGCVLVNAFRDLGLGFTTSNQISPSAGGVVDRMMLQIVLQSTSPGGSAIMSLKLGGAGTYPTGTPEMQLSVTSYSSEAIL
jgi:hypothetical protein